MRKYVIVQHSGYGYGFNPQFMDGIEPRGCGVRTANRVAAEGGVVFDSWIEADRYCDTEPYQPDNHGLIPKVPGTFARTKVDGLSVYLPPIRQEQSA